MLNFTNQYGNANRNHNKSPSNHKDNSYYLKKKKTENNKYC